MQHATLIVGNSPKAWGCAVWQLSSVRHRNSYSIRNGALGHADACHASTSACSAAVPSIRDAPTAAERASPGVST